MALALFKPKDNDRNLTRVSEERLSNVVFNVYKLNNRPKPKKRNRIKIVSCFSEFGCETVGCLYCIPRLLKRFPGCYIIVMGWYGREYLYRHLVDEFWEIKEEYMWLRDHARAFHHNSLNLEKLEKSASEHGDVIPAAALGKYAIGNFCRTCGKFWNEWRKKNDECPKCKSTYIIKSIFSDTGNYRKTAVPIPKPRKSYLEWAKGVVPENCVGIFARGRKTYGRNLEPSFYVELIQMLERMGHNVIWLGEKQSTQPCPVDHVVDFSRMDESQELERTLAIICQLDFTVQFWTASTRLAGMMGIPFLLFESPEQIYCTGLNPAQEGKRLELTSFGPKKVVLAHYLNVLREPDAGLALAQRAIEEMKLGNYEDIIGMVDDQQVTEQLKEWYQESLNV